MPSKEAGHCVRAVVGCWGGGSGGGRLCLFLLCLFLLRRLLLRGSGDMVTKRMAKSCSFLDDVC